MRDYFEIVLNNVTACLVDAFNNTLITMFLKL